MDERPIHICAVGEAEDDARLDLFLAAHIETLPRNRIQNLIKAGEVRVDGVRVVKPAHRLRSGNRVELQEPPPLESKVTPQDLPLEILFEDDALAVINKAPGIAVHPTPITAAHTVVNALLFHLKNLSGIGGVLRPGIVHRLDRGTSGVMVVAKTDAAHHGIARQFADRTTEKEYLALVQGHPAQREGRIDAPVGRHPRDRKLMAVAEEGREAQTEYAVAEWFADHALIRARPRTGRTHQIRVHLKTLHCHIVGDTAYGYRSRTEGDKLVAALVRDYPGFCLHAAKLAFDHPRTGERQVFEAPLPEGYARILETFRRSTALDV